MSSKKLDVVRVVLAAVTTVGLLAPAIVAAQPAPEAKPKVYAFPFVRGEGVSEVVFNKVEQYYLTLFKMSTKFELLSDEELKTAEAAKMKAEKRASAQVSPPWLEKADNLLWTGKDLLVKKEQDKAIAALQEAKELYEEHYLELRDYDKLVDVNLQLAIAFFMAGYKDNGDELLKDVIVWRPTLVVDRKKYPKEFVDSLENLKTLLENRKGGIVRVEATPADGAKVFVDGLLKGTLTGDQQGIDISGLFRGRHYVQVIKDGYQIFAEKIGVPEEGRTKKVVAQLALVPEEKIVGGGEWEGVAFTTYQFALTGDFGMEFSNNAKKFADGVQIPYLLFGFVSKEDRRTRLTLFLFKAEWSGLAEVEPVDFDENLTNLQVNLLFLEANLASALAKFPKNRVVRQTPEVYLRSRDLAAKKAEPVVVAVVEPVKTEPVKTEPVKTEPVKTEPVKTEPVKTEPVKTQPVKTEPVRTEPVKVTTTIGERDPLLTSRTEPTRAADDDLGDLSSIFADTGDTGTTTLSSSGIPTVPAEKKDDWGGGSKSDGITSKWWFWTAVAAGAGLVGGGGYLAYEAMSGSTAPSGYSAHLQWGQ